jgi:hypothetical protein
MRKAAAKLIFLSTLVLITSISWMPVDAIVTKKVNPRSGTPSQPKPAPSPTPAPGDGGAPLPCWPLCTGSGLK